MHLPHDAGRVLTQRLQASGRAESLRDILVALSAPREHPRIREICGEVADALSKRNTFIHGVLFVNQVLTTFSDGAAFSDGTKFSSPELRIRNRGREHALSEAAQVELALSEAYGKVADLITPYLRLERQDP